MLIPNKVVEDQVKKVLMELEELQTDMGDADLMVLQVAVIKILLHEAVENLHK